MENNYQWAKKQMIWLQNKSEIFFWGGEFEEYETMKIETEKTEWTVTSPIARNVASKLTRVTGHQRKGRGENREPMLRIVSGFG